MKLESKAIARKVVGTTYQVIQFDGGHTLADTRDDLLRYGSSVDMLRIEAIAQPRHTGCDLVKLDALFASICHRVTVISILFESSN